MGVSGIGIPIPTVRSRDYRNQTSSIGNRSLTRTRVRDQEHSASLEASGWRVLVVWECQLKSPLAVPELIAEFLGNRGCQDVPAMVSRDSPKSVVSASSTPPSGQP